MQEKLEKLGDNTMCPIAVIIRDKKVLLGHRHYTSDKWQDISVWTCPGGRCDHGEAIEETLRREVAEEVGITDLHIIDFIGDFPGAKEGDIVPVFICESDQAVKNTEPHKFSEWRWFSLNEFPSEFINEDIAPKIKKLLA